MRLIALITALFVVSPALAEAPSERFDANKFKQRFKAADLNRDGKLSREEAYAAFPRMPEFFDEIDSNRDNHITLSEVKRAMDKRVANAMSASHLGNQRYALPGSTDQDATASDNKPVFSSRAEARRAFRVDYYESLAGQRPQGQLASEPIPAVKAPAQINKSF